MSYPPRITGCLTSAKETIAFTKSLCDAVGITISVSAPTPAATGLTGLSQGPDNQTQASPSLQQSATTTGKPPGSTPFTGLAHGLVAETVWHYTLFGIALAHWF